ncbi:MAG: hypothetical protein OXI26_07050 [bacterium]|nr:hypothetical protein [bacterium]
MRFRVPEPSQGLYTSHELRTLRVDGDRELLAQLDDLAETAAREAG